MEMTESSVVGISVQDGEEDGEGLLHAQDPEKGPFAVELLDGEAITDAAGSDGLLTGVIAILRAGPQCEAEMEWEGGWALGADTALRSGSASNVAETLDECE